MHKLRVPGPPFANKATRHVETLSLSLSFFPLSLPVLPSKFFSLLAVAITPKHYRYPCQSSLFSLPVLPSKLFNRCAHSAGPVCKLMTGACDCQTNASPKLPPRCAKIAPRSQQSPQHACYHSLFSIPGGLPGSGSPSGMPRGSDDFRPGLPGGGDRKGVYTLLF